MGDTCVALGDEAREVHAEVRTRSPERSDPVSCQVGEAAADNLLERRLVARVHRLDKPFDEPLVPRDTHRPRLFEPFLRTMLGVEGMGELAQSALVRCRDVILARTAESGGSLPYGRARGSLPGRVILQGFYRAEGGLLGSAGINQCDNPSGQGAFPCLDR
jgi:hypothetical protein